ncbi:MAG: DUF2911 domain-containing protein [Flavobacteriaceae bacterium]
MRIYISTILVFIASGLMAQMQTPQPSPSAMLKQTVGLTEISIEYSRPAMRGRVIMGDLVPYGAIWRTGANANTTIQFSDPVSIGSTTIPAGTYAIFTRPGQKMWEVFFYSKTDNWGAPTSWDVQAVAATYEAEVHTLSETVSSFTISIGSITNNDAVLEISWENTKVGIPIAVPTKAKMQKSIAEAMKNNPKAQDYYSAAVYYLQEGLDLQQAKSWMEQSLKENNEAYWVHRQYALILAGLNEMDAAIAAAKTSLELAEKAGNQDYVKMNTESIAAWQK